MIRRIIATALVFSSLVLATGCGFAWQVKIEGEEEKPHKTASQRKHRKGPPKVPPGHMPPPGKCRIWHPGTPPGKQPPPGDCDELRRRVPPDAWLIEG
ncbi:MAG: hypothetical protein ACLFQB_05205 [Chitinispirillaceae bacterium]